MVDAVINMLLDRLVPIVAQTIHDDLFPLINSKKEAKNLEITFRNIQKVLVEAEKKRVTEPRVKAWLEKIEEAAYEMDDVLDELQTKRLGREIKRSQHIYGCWSKVSSFIHSLSLCPKHVAGSYNIALKIKRLNGRLESIARENDREFKFLPKMSKFKSRDSQDWNPVTSSSFVDESRVKGRDEDKHILVSKLLSEGGTEGNDNLQIFSIVGTGGLGKTTLAQLVLNDSRVVEHFQYKIWIFVSKPFNEITIARKILQFLGRSSEDLTEFDMLLQRIKTCILGKRLLLVLDDVWNEDEERWMPLKMSLENGAPGSKVLVTTRNERVATMMGSAAPEIYHLRLLFDDECFELLSQIAFQGKTNEDPERLADIGLKIAQKCQGLPLAAKTLGSLLSFKYTREEWEAVLNSEIWNLEIAEERIFNPLYLSYDELRPAVKRCFSYCALFVKGSTIKVDEMIRMWMAQGFLSSGNTEESELLGLEYFRDLAVRSFFQDLDIDPFFTSLVRCKMHDILHDFAQFLSKSECSILQSVDQKAESLNVRHLTWKIDADYSNRFAELFAKTKKLRTFLCESKLDPNLLSTLKSVRALSLLNCHFYLKELPWDIGNLIHLRYLKLSDIKQLPKTVCVLYNLQTLDVEECRDLYQLPEEIGKLVNLRHLLVDEIIPFPQGLEKLTSLRTLRRFYAGRRFSKLGLLKNLYQLDGFLTILLDGLTEESDVIDASHALQNKKRLEFLRLDFKEASMDVIDALQPPPNLNGLKITNYKSIRFPHWITVSLNSLKFLFIYTVENCSSLPALGKLSSLEELYISMIESMKSLGHEFLGIDPQESVSTSFPKLKKLEIAYCEEWTKWEDITEEEETAIKVMPCLRELEVNGCPKLKSLPHRLLRRAPLEHLCIKYSDSIVEKYRFEGVAGFLNPKCKLEL